MASKANNPERTADKLAEFMKAALAAGYHPSGAAQLWREANPQGSYGRFMRG